ncbi:MAG TPA: hypothetical protein DEB24_06790 [Coriobacteriia bacterium]|nr:hypothetical protein [Coriobacteriia bacterium]
MTEELDVLLREVDKKKAELGLKPELAPDVLEAFEERFLYDCIYQSNAIEGNRLTREEVEHILKNNEVIEGKSLSDHVLVLGYRDATLIGQRYAKNNIRITEFEIKRLHYMMLIDRHGEGSEYRDYNMMIHGHRPTSYEKVPYKMMQLVESKPSEDRHPLESIAYFHLRLEKIHPFGDGNGRVGRVIVNIMLEQAGYPAIIFNADDKQEYYEALSAYDGLDGKPRVEPMQILLAKLVIRQLDERLAL